MKLGSLIILFLVCLSCKNDNEHKNTSNSTNSERLEIVPEPDRDEKENHEKNLNLTSFLENPIDLQEFKNKKKEMSQRQLPMGWNITFTQR